MTECNNCTNGLVDDKVCDVCKGTGQLPNGEPTEQQPAASDQEISEAFEAGKKVGFDEGYKAGIDEARKVHALIVDPEEEASRVEAEKAEAEAQAAAEAEAKAAEAEAEAKEEEAGATQAPSG